MDKLIILLTLGVWIGLVLGLSFIETPLKFHAPGITTELGVGIGQLVFGVLNKIEITFVVILAIAHYGMMKNMNSVYIILCALIFSIVLFQTVYLLPILDARVQSLLDGEMLKSSNDHFIYVAVEVIKLISLFILFSKSYKIDPS